MSMLFDNEFLFPEDNNVPSQTDVQFFGEGETIFGDTELPGVESKEFDSNSFMKENVGDRYSSGFPKLSLIVKVEAVILALLAKVGDSSKMCSLFNSGAIERQSPTFQAMYTEALQAAPILSLYLKLGTPGLS